MPKGAGKPCGAGFIAAWKTCKAGASAHPEFVSAKAKEADALKDKILKNLSTYTPAQQDAWEKHIGDSFKEHGSSVARHTVKTQEDVYVLKLKGWEKLTREGPPKELFDQNGESIGSSKSLVPTVTGRTGAPAWKAVEQGVTYKYQPGKKGQEGQWRQSTVSMYNDIKSGRVQKAIDLYDQKKAEANKKGTPIDYPVLKLGKRVDPKEVDKYLKEVTDQGRLSSVAGNGTNRNATTEVGDKGAYGRTLVAAVQNRMLRSKDEQEARARNIIEAWLRQDKKSAFTGEPVSIPSIRDKNGYPSVVDHNTPLSTAWKGNPKGFREPEQVKKALGQYDVASNFSITERGLNTSKSDQTDWGGVIIPRWRNAVEGQKKREVEAAKVVDLRRPSSASFVERPSQEPSRNPYTVANAPAKEDLSTKLENLLRSVRGK
jgi:hypothetical protein